MTQLQSLLEQSRDYAPTFRGGLANHLPMVLIALARLGAKDEQLQAFFDHYRKRLAPLAAVTPERWPGWALSIGQSEAFPRFLAHFKVALAEEGRDEVLHAALPKLMPGVCASAFHALIRLAYGIRQDDDDEVAHALAYWAADWQDLGPIQTPSDCSMEELLVERAAPFARHRFGGGIIVDRMREISRHPEFILGLQQPAQIDWPSIIQLARRAYRDNGNFTVLHGLTSAHAMWIIKPWIEQEEQALRYYWLAYLVAFISTRLPVPGPETKARPDIDPAEATAWAVTRQDDHDIKLVYSCLDFYRAAEADQKPYWLAAIERRVADQTIEGAQA